MTAMGVLRHALDVRVPSAPGSERPLLRLWPFAVFAALLTVLNAVIFAGEAGFGALSVPAALIAGYLGHLRTLRRRDTLRVAAEFGRRQVLEERARIARELHDMVAHHMSVIAVRAASAPYRIDGGVGEGAAREFADLGGAAREALRDMRHLLGALRGTDVAPETAPQPGLSDLGALVDTVRRAGLPVTLACETAEPTPVHSLTAYRIVQEALSNVVRHAPGAATSVAVRDDAGTLVIEVENAPSAGGVVAQPGSGLGLIGMRERVAALGGGLTTGVVDGGGFAVRAWLPKGDE
ncbi:hypothetical protein GCM10009560_34120 [Nonomuraea longicatena]|uniref:histidine kinase n=2 Tax=Nonomuraea longicatena TaxID=83682 RepID=A0ABN1PMM1_9ACTN